MGSRGMNEATRPFFAFEKDMNQYMRAYYDLYGCTYDWNAVKNNFIGDKKKDVTLYYDNQKFLIEHKFRRVIYPDVLVEINQDIKTNNSGWLYECGAEVLLYIICRPTEGVVQPIYFYKIEFKLFKNWFFSWLETEQHPNFRICKDKGYGITLNTVVPINDIPEDIISPKVWIKEKE